MLRHLRERCGRRQVSPPPEEAPSNPPADALQRVVDEHRRSIETSIARGAVQSRYNYRMIACTSTRVLEPRLRVMFSEQKHAFKINVSYGFVLRHKVSGRYRYYHSSCNCCGRLLETPALVTDSRSFERFLDVVRTTDVLQYAIAQRPDSGWVVELVTNATYFVNAILNHPIGCVGAALPAYLRNNKHVVTLTNDRRGTPYDDHLCLFRCIGLHLQQRGTRNVGKKLNSTRLTRVAKQLHARYGGATNGVRLNELERVETVFGINIVVYRLTAAGAAELVRRSLETHPTTLNVNLYEKHFSYILDLRAYAKTYKCSKCGNSLWRYPSELRRHEATCEGGVRHVFPGGVYRPTPSVFQRLDDEGVDVGDDDLRYYPFRATFDFECYFAANELPPDTDKCRWLARHELLSVSVASNVPGHEAARCYVTTGDSAELARRLIDDLEAVSAAACAVLRPRYDAVFEALEALDDDWRRRRGDDDNDASPYAALADRLWTHLRQMPVLGFNSGKYDLNVVKKYLTPLLITDDAQHTSSAFTIKRQNNYMCLTTSTLKFLDITNYLAPGVSYERYLKAYGCAATKGYFPYEYIDALTRLDETVLPPRESFYSHLKRGGV